MTQGDLKLGELDKRRYKICLPIGWLISYLTEAYEQDNVEWSCNSAQASPACTLPHRMLDLTFKHSSIKVHRTFVKSDLCGLGFKASSNCVLKTSTAAAYKSELLRIHHWRQWRTCYHVHLSASTQDSVEPEQGSWTNAKVLTVPQVKESTTIFTKLNLILILKLDCTIGTTRSMGSKWAETDSHNYFALP